MICRNRPAGYFSLLSVRTDHHVYDTVSSLSKTYLVPSSTGSHRGEGPCQGRRNGSATIKHGDPCQECHSGTQRRHHARRHIR